MDVYSTDYFVRQATVPSIGEAGLKKLRSSTVAIVGAGGVGSSAAYYLARSGLGRVKIFDQDIIEPSNLARIHGATNDDLYRPKAEVVSQKLSCSNQSLHVEAVVDTITDRNVKQLFKDVDLVVDGLDNFRTRYTVNRFAYETQTPYLFTSAIAEQAHLALLNPPHTACLQCIMPSVVDRFEESCETLGVTPTITGLSGAIAAHTTIQFLLGEHTRWADHLMTIDLGRPEFLFNRLTKRIDCTLCTGIGTHNAQASPSVTLLCGEHTANALPPEHFELQLSTLSARIPAERILACSDSVLVYQHGRLTISLFRNGRILVGGVRDELEASSIVNEVWQALRDGRSVEISPFTY